MRIALVSTLSAPVRRETHGSVESLVWLMIRGMTRLGHEVTVFGTADSEVEGELVAELPGSYGAKGSPDDWQLCEWLNLCRAVGESGRFDVVHMHAYLWGMPLERFSQAPLVHTLHIVPDENAVRLWSGFPGARVTALSRHQWSGWPERRPMAVIPHGVDPEAFAWRGEAGEYVCYVGRFVSGKGPLQAIATARRLGLRIVLAGPKNGYYRERIEPLVDGDQVRYAGYVTGAERSELMGRARALLYPIQYPEAFGLVLVEAMMCGTPVAAIGVGAVPEVVDQGVSGAIVESMEAFDGAVTQAMTLDRRRVRERAVERFSADRMVRDYLEVYERVVGNGGER
ncbi:MAG TPA: glycosyltransferase family 4 protein [Methylomirabilota bacterium]|nr:glycosyltransferase family 4 protein [Methylomirabilota bacterium]